MRKFEEIDEHNQLGGDMLTNGDSESESKSQSNKQNELIFQGLDEARGSLETSSKFEMQNDQIEYTSAGNLSFENSFDINDEIEWFKQGNEFLFEDSTRPLDSYFYKSQTYDTLFPESAKTLKLPISSELSNTNTNIDMTEDNFEFMDFTSASIELRSTDDFKNPTNPHTEPNQSSYKDAIKASEEMLKIKNEIFEEIYTILSKEAEMRTFHETKISSNPLIFDNLSNTPDRIQDFNKLKNTDLVTESLKEVKESLIALNPSLQTAIYKELSDNNYPTHKSSIQVIKLALNTRPTTINSKISLKNTKSRKPRTNGDSQSEIENNSIQMGATKGDDIPIVQLGAQISVSMKRQNSISLSSNSSLHSLEIEPQPSFDFENENFDKKEITTPSIEDNALRNTKRDQKIDSKNIVSRFVSSISLNPGKSKQY